MEKSSHDDLDVERSSFEEFLSQGQVVYPSR